LTSPSVKFEWTEACEDAFCKLRNALVSAPILTIARPDLPFVLSTDASDVAIGAVLEQEQEGVCKVVAYASRKLYEAERNYSVTERECLFFPLHIGFLTFISICMVYTSLWSRTMRLLSGFVHLDIQKDALHAG
jgi:hypothetical protein